ncbi:hypothetical protein BEL04_21190 [Mucilaginibacter sp. PPCGB 2223]|uniref:hypothetical protein n=1 Tax=Mucilaginibacter sp. PPCGB 2223 TaxID=1886027 RepID=UPI000826EDEE|nr:hypothetical protein [Mucilaginibacter sp. PPCGB 2223]OCX51220.1 hypothetical protein BEL04_21190 [Mucilaginibacter sp. PPCGB 2223]
MKTKSYYLLLGVLPVVLFSCSRGVYNNHDYLSAHDLSGKKLAVLPVEVYYTGIPAAKGDTYTEEEATSLEAQSALEQAYLMYTARHSAKKYQHHVEMINGNQVNDRIKSAVPDLRSAWKMAPDSLGRLAGADLVLKVRLVRTRFMSEGLAKGINTGTTILDAVINTSSNGGLSFTPGVKAYSVTYEVSLIDAKTGTLISSTANEKEKDRNGDSIKKINELMAEKAAVYAALN